MTRRLTKKEKEKIKEACEQLIDKGKRAFNTSIGFIGKDVFEMRPKEVCSAILNREIEQEGVEVIVCTVQTDYKEGDTLPDAVYRRYYNWLTKKSPWRGVFLRKNSRQILKEGAVFDASYASNMLVGALIAFRYPFEFPHRVRMWDSCVKANMGEAFAFLMCHLYERGEDGTISSDNCSFHKALDISNMSLPDYRRFVEGIPLRLDDPWNLCGSYGRISQTFLSGKGESLAKGLLENGAVMTGRAANPFYLVDYYAPAEYRVRKLFKNMREFEKRLMK